MSAVGHGEQGDPATTPVEGHETVGRSTSNEIAIPGTWEIVSLDDEAACAQALASLREFESQIREAKAALTNAIVERSKVLGSRTLHLPSGLKAVVKGGGETVYDAEEIEAGLREAGMPEDRIREIVKETTSYSVAAVKAKQAAAANEAYAQVIAEHSRFVPKAQYVSLER